MAVQVSILVPNYKTLELTKLCLRLIRKYTSKGIYRVIVIDNDSQDASTEYLRSLKWVTLIERKAVPGEEGYHAHSRALDLAMEQVDTPYVLSIHTDTLVRDSKWLEFLLSKITQSDNVAGVGSWKLESKPWMKRTLKKIEYALEKLCCKKRKGHAGHYLRSHCALYRVDLIRKLSLSFSANNETAGLHMHHALVDAGYDMLFLTSEELGVYVDHINHATMILHPELGAKKKTIKEGQKRIQKRLDAVNAKSVLADHRLDD